MWICSSVCKSFSIKKSYGLSIIFFSEKLFSCTSQIRWNCWGIQPMNNDSSSIASNYWKKSLSLVAKLLSVWFIVSFGCGILFKEQLDQFSIGGAPLGFWMAQQGSIICFVILLILYAYLMNKLDKEHGYEEEGE